MLQARFGQPAKIQRAHLRALVNLMKPNDTLPSLRKFLDTLESHIRELDALGKKTDSYGDLLVCIVLDKLPADTLKNLPREHRVDEWCLDDLRRALFQELQVLESGGAQLKQSQPRQQQQGHPPAAALHYGASYPTQQATTRSCVYCREDHSHVQCSKVREPKERLKIVQKNNLCSNCLIANHKAAQCFSKGRCYICQKKHHSSLHDEQFEQKRSAAPVQPRVQPAPASTVQPAPTDVNPIIAGTIAANKKSFVPQVFLKTAVGTIASNDCRCTANILFDDGSHRSFITTKLSKEIGLETIRKEVVQLSAFGEAGGATRVYDVKEFSIVTDSGEFVKITALSVPLIAAPLRNKISEDIRNLPYIKSLKLAHPVCSEEEFNIDVLIGGDYYYAIVGDENIRGPGPTATASKIGYLLSGPSGGGSTAISSRATNLHVSLMADDTDLSRLWTLESMGIQPENEEQRTVEEYQKKCIVFEEGAYKARLPRVESHPKLPSNLEICMKRTRSTARRLFKKPSLFTFYSKILQDQLERGFIEKFDISPRPASQGHHYIPHQEVIRDSETTPIRMVFDCSCKGKNGVSLNSCLQTGPPLQTDIIDILLSFRLRVSGLVSDVEKAFHHVRLHEDDRDSVRFLWLTNEDDPESPFQAYRFRVVPFGAKSSPFILNAVILKHLKENDSAVSRDMLASIYVDNLVTGCQTTEDALNYYQEAKSTLQSAGFNLKIWATNDPVVAAKLEEDGRLDKATHVKVLGMQWLPAIDELRFPIFNILSTDKSFSTKRDVLRGAAAVYDPLGLLTPITIRARFLLQDLWKEEFAWDQPLPDAFHDRWIEIARDIEAAATSQIKRRYDVDESSNNYKLHVYVDASKQGYGAVVFLVNGSKTSFVIAKSRVAPVKTLTLPQLELMAAVLGSRLAATVQKSFNRHLSFKTVMWSDAQIVLHWIKDGGKTTFVNNRVAEIQKLNKKHGTEIEWKYCPTKDNPADFLTRGATLEEFNLSSLWKVGPDWISTEADWPKWNQSSRASCLHVSSLHTVVEEESVAAKLDISNCIDETKFGDCNKLFRVTAWVKRFLKNRKLPLHERQFGELTAAELKAAEDQWIRSSQRRFLPAETQYFDKKKQGRRPTVVSQLDLFRDEDRIIRCGGRMKKAEIPEAARHPVLIPRHTHLSKLIIIEAHSRVLHSGSNVTITAVRQKYWIPALRQQVKSIIHRCVICRRVSGPAYQQPDHAGLPEWRVTESRPFYATGVDYTGAITVLDVNKKEIKVYICLFTCGATRSVHLEVVEDLTTAAFIRAFRRFCGRRGLPALMVSDNASTFECAADVIENIFKNPKIERYFAERRIKWKFIPKRAPWYGGFWERLIGLTKTTLRKCLWRKKIQDYEMRTLIVDIEAVLNDRPLTHPSTDLADGEPLTPSHLTHGFSLTSLPTAFASEEEYLDPTYGEEPSALSRRAQYLHGVFKGFWQRWRKEYLTALREKHSATKGKKEEVIQVGDIVLIHGDELRIKWKYARVESLIYSEDGVVRAANLCTADGQTNRPISKLYPLEVRAKAIPPTPSSIPDGPVNKQLLPSSTTNVPSAQRKKRDAALRATDRIRAIAEEDEREFY